LSDFTIGRAWRHGIDFVKRSPSGHALLLILAAAILPALIQNFLIGGSSSPLIPAAFGRGDAAEALLGTGLGTVLAVLAVYALTVGGYLGSLRLGLGRDAELGRSATYGMIAGLAVVGLAFAVGLAAVVLIQLLGWIAGLLIMLVLLPLFAAFFAVSIGMVAAAMIVTGTLILIFVVLMTGTDSPFGGASLFAVAVMVPAGLVALWATARLCCTTPAMACRESLNLIEALRESWRLTGNAQLRIMLYLAIVGLILGLVYVILVFAMTSSVGAAAGRAGAGASARIGIFIFSSVAAILSAYISVLVPAGIYRALQPDVDASAAVFE
jgi:hypothetical protein